MKTLRGMVLPARAAIAVASEKCRQGVDGLLCCDRTLCPPLAAVNFASSLFLPGI